MLNFSYPTNVGVNALMVKAYPPSAAATSEVPGHHKQPLAGCV